MKTSLAESQTDSYGQLLSHKVAKWLTETKRCKRHILSKTNYNKNEPWQKNRLGTVSEKYSILGGHNPRPYFCRGLDT